MKIMRSVGLVLIGIAATGVAHWTSVEAQTEAQERPFAIAAFTCPDGYDGVEYAVDCTEPLANAEFDLAGPVNNDVTTNADGVADFGDVPLAKYTVEALDFDSSQSFVVSCTRAIRGGPFPADITYTDAGFKVDIAKEYDRQLPVRPSGNGGLTCNWYAIPDPPFEHRPGIVAVDDAFCEGAADQPELLVTEPGGQGEEMAGLRFGSCMPQPGSFTLASKDHDSQTAIDFAPDPQSQTGGYVLTGVPEGEYTLTEDATGAQAALRVFAGEETVALAVNPKASGSLEPIAFDAGDWQGAFPNINTGVYNRAAVAVYGSLSPFHTATLSFDLSASPSGDTILTIDGLDDELAAAVQIEITVNGQQVYTGPSGFANWNPDASPANWSSVDFTIPAGILQSGGNEIAVSDLANSANVGLPPYVLLGTATLSFTG